MQYKAIVSFSGNISMAMGDVREISDTSIANDLLRAGYVISFEADNSLTENKEEIKPKTKRKGKKDGY